MKKTVEQYLHQLQPHHRDAALTMVTSRHDWKVNSLQEALQVLKPATEKGSEWIANICKMLNDEEYFDAPQHSPEDFKGKAKAYMREAAQEAHKPTILPSDAKERKEYPIFAGFINYFPHAVAAVAHQSYLGNQQHHPDRPLHWDMDKSQDELDALMRHMLEGDWEAVAWRAMANLERKLTNQSTYKD